MTVVEAGNYVKEAPKLILIYLKLDPWKCILWEILETAYQRTTYNTQHALCGLCILGAKPFLWETATVIIGATVAGRKILWERTGLPFLGSRLCKHRFVFTITFLKCQCRRWKPASKWKKSVAMIKWARQLESSVDFWKLAEQYFLGSSKRKIIDKFSFSRRNVTFGLGQKPCNELLQIQFCIRKWKSQKCCNFAVSVLFELYVSKSFPFLCLAVAQYRDIVDVPILAKLLVQILVRHLPSYNDE